MNLSFVNVELGENGRPVVNARGKMPSVFDINRRRPYRGDGDEDHLAFINNHVGKDEKGQPKWEPICVGNASEATLRKDEWIQLDATIREVAHRRMAFVNMLERNGCTINIAAGMGATIYQWQNVSDLLSGVRLDMDGIAQGDKDSLLYDLSSLPLPIAHRNWSLNLRYLEESRTKGVGMDTLLASENARLIAEFTENMFINGASSFTFGGGTIYGLLDSPTALTSTGLKDWLDAGTDPEDIVNDIKAGIQKLADANHHGPFTLCVPQRWENALDADYNPTQAGQTSSITLRERIMKLSKIKEIVLLDFLQTQQIALVELNKETIAVVSALDLRDFEWQDLGGWVFEHKLAQIKVPLIRADFRGQCGVWVGTCSTSTISGTNYDVNTL